MLQGVREMGKKPNIVIIMTDQQRADLRRGEGYELDTMPFVDSLSENGVDFAGAYTANPTCMPARVSMLTGRYCGAHRVRTNHNAEDALYTKDMLDVLKESGYVTALCGKNHSHRSHDDFDFCAPMGHLGALSGKNSLETTPEDEEFERFMNKTDFIGSETASVGSVKQQMPYRSVTSAFDFIDNHTKNSPFFLWLSFAEPHNPYQVPKPYFDMFSPESLPEEAYDDKAVRGKGFRYSWIKDVWKKLLGEDSDRHLQRMRSNYHGMLRLIDDQIKRFAQGLSERGLAEDTIVLFLADHGDFAGKYGLMRKGPDLPDVLCRIPMIWFGAGVKAQGRIDGKFASITDVFPTVCDIIGAKLPFGCQGKSLLPILKGENIPEHEFDEAYCESGFSGLYWNDDDDLDLITEGACKKGRASLDCLNSWTQCGQVRMLRRGDYKLQLDMLGTGYLYNLKNDPDELCNLWEDKACKEVKAQMLASLAAFMMRAEDPIPAPHSRYRVKLHPKGYWYDNYKSGDVGVTDLPALKMEKTKE